MDYKRFKKFFSFVIIILTFFWLGSIIYHHRSYGGEVISYLWIPENYSWFGIAFIFGCLSSFLVFYIFKAILIHNSSRSIPATQIMQLFFLSQIIRYLPGRMLGVVYQIVDTKDKIHPSVIIKSNVELIILSLLFSCLLGLAVMFFYIYGWLGCLLFSVLGIFIFVQFVRLNLLENLIAWIARVIPNEKIRSSIQFESRSELSSSLAINILLLFAISWICYFLAWFCLGKIFREENMILMCITYTLAYIIGMVSMLTPGGLGVRESAFILFSTKLAHTSNLAFISIFMRFWLMLIDVFLFCLVLFIMRLQKKSTSY